MNIQLLNDVARMKFATAIVTGWCLLAPAQAGAAPLKTGVGRASINPMEDKIPTPLGGYEVTASFYGQGLGQLLLDHAKGLGLAVAAKK